MPGAVTAPAADHPDPINQTPCTSRVGGNVRSLIPSNSAASIRLYSDRSERLISMRCDSAGAGGDNLSWIGAAWIVVKFTVESVPPKIA